jgi:exosortase/archaeosortase family protein
VAKNGLRIFTLAMIFAKVDPEIFSEWLHRQGGVIFLLIALAAILLLVWILRRGEHQLRRTEAPHQGTLS